MFDDVFKCILKDKVKTYADRVPEEDFKYLEKCVKYFELVDGWIELVGNNLIKTYPSFEKLVDKRRWAYAHLQRTDFNSPEYIEMEAKADDIDRECMTVYNRMLDKAFSPFSASLPYNSFTRASRWLSFFNTMGMYALQYPLNLFPKPFDMYSRTNLNELGTSLHARSLFIKLVVHPYEKYKTEWFKSYNKLKDIRNVR